MAMAKEWLDFLRQQYPTGSRIELRETQDDLPLPHPSALGTLKGIDDAGRFHVKWNDGRTLYLAVGKDSFTILPPGPTVMKLYAPLKADQYGPSEFGDPGDDSIILDGTSLLTFKDQIMRAMTKNRIQGETERGIMHWYDKDDSVNHKVRSAAFTVEDREGQLWGVAECQVYGTLMAEELMTLKDFITKQVSDNPDDRFGLRAIKVGEAELDIELGKYEEDWSIQTEEECFGLKLTEELPELCFSVLDSTGELICIRRGERGYVLSDWNTNDPEWNQQLANDHNEKLGVTFAERRAMEISSMRGWNIPSADPADHQMDHSPGNRGSFPEMMMGGM